MEYLHSCYSTSFRLWVGGVEKIVPARWYFTDPGAKIFTLPMAFCSNVYAKPGEESAPGPGEVNRLRVWDKGINSGYKGQEIDGDPSWFETGQLPMFVGPPPEFKAICHPPIFGQCGGCYSNQPHSWALETDGFTGPLSQFNGSWVVPFTTGVNPCAWQLFAPDFQITLGFDGMLWILLFAMTGHSAEYLMPPGKRYECLGPNTFKLFNITDGHGPLLVTLHAV